MSGAQLEEARAFMRERWPDEQALLLVDVALAPEDIARAAWQSWKSTNTLDAAPWPSVRAIAAASDRIIAFDPDNPDAGRIRGFKRFFFTAGQKTFAEARPMMLALRDAGVDMMLLKGAARIAGHASAATVRYVGDVDVLIRPEQRDLAWQVARDRDWFMPRALSPISGGTWEGHALTSHALEFSPSPATKRTVLDLHHYSRSLCRNPGDDDTMWTHAARTAFLGLEAFVPAPTDRLRHSLTHALMHAEIGRSVDWIHDAREMLSEGEIDWQRLADETLTSRTQGFVGAALLLLRERVGFDVPGTVIDRLAEALKPPFTGELKFRTSAYFHNPKPTTRLHAQTVAAAELRANDALARKPDLAPSPRRKWKVSRRVLSVPTIKRGYTSVDVPDDIQPGENMWIEVTVRRPSDAPRGLLVLVSPRSTLRAWELDKVFADGRKRARLRVKVPSTLYAISGAKVTGLRYEGAIPMKAIEVRWVRDPIRLALQRRVRRLTRRLKRGTRRLLKRLTGRGGPRRPS